MFKVDEIESVVKDMFSRFFADLLLRIGVSVSVQLFPEASRKKGKPPTASQYVHLVALCMAIKKMQIDTSLFGLCQLMCTNISYYTWLLSVARLKPTV